MITQLLTVNLMPPAHLCSKKYGSHKWIFLWLLWNPHIVSCSWQNQSKCSVQLPRLQYMYLSVSGWQGSHSFCVSSSGITWQAICLISNGEQIKRNKASCISRVLWTVVKTSASLSRSTVICSEQETSKLHVTLVSVCWQHGPDKLQTNTYIKLLSYFCF